MADTRENIILEVGLDAGKVAKDLADISRQIANVKRNQQDLNEQYKNGEISLAQYTAQTEALKDEQTWLQKEQKGLIATTKLLSETTDTYSDSLNGERQKLADMQKAYDQLDANMRKGEGGQRFLEAIKQQSDVVKGLEEETGRFQRNVGNYKSAFDGAADKAKLLNDAFKQTTAGSSTLGKGVDSLDKTAKVLTKNPVFAIIGLIAPLLAKIAEKVGQNEKLMNALNKVMKPIGDVLQWVANIISNMLVRGIEAFSNAWQKVSGFFSRIGNTIGITTKSVNDNTDATKANEEELAKYRVEIDKTVASLDEEKKALQRVIKERQYELNLLKAKGASEEEIAAKTLDNLQKEIDDRRKLAKEAGETLTKTNQIYEEWGLLRNGMLYADKETIASYKKLAEAYRNSQQDVLDAQRAYNIEYETQQTKQREQETKAQSDEQKKREAAYKEYLSRLRTMEIEEYERTFQARATLLELETQQLLEATELMKQQAQSALEWLDETEEEEYIPTPDEMARNIFGLDEDGVEYFRSLLNEGVSISEAKTRAITDQTRRMTLSFADSFGELGNAFEQMSDALGAYSEDNEAAAKAQKAFALSGIILNQAQSISEGALAVAKGVESAAGIPFPANIPAIISISAQIGAMIAGVMSSISQAKQVFSQANDAGNFAHGGTIEGTSYTGDKLIAHVNSGEGIYTGKQANNLLQDIANNPLHGGNLDAMTAAFTAALAAMPAPKMVYSEFNDFTQEVAIYNELAAI